MRKSVSESTAAPQDPARVGHQSETNGHSNGAAIKRSTDRGIPVSLFRNLTNPEATFEEWSLDHLRERLTTHTIRPNKDGPLFSPTVYRDGATGRANASVIWVTALVADCDESHTLEHIRSIIKRLGVFAIIYSSHRHGITEKDDAAAPGERYRVVFVLKKSVLLKNWPDVWERLNLLFDSAMDSACKDASRAYFLPSHPTGIGTVAEVIEGRYIELEDLPPLTRDFLDPKFEPMPPAAAGEGRPGDDYNAQADNATVAAILERAGCKIYESASSVWRFKRPNKKGGISGTIGFYGPGTVYVFTSEFPPFQARHCYKPFQVKSLLEHDGDFKAAARDLKKLGFGESTKSKKSKTTAAAPLLTQPTLGLFNLTDLGNSERLINQHGADLRYCYAWNKWLVWNGKQWKADARGEIKKRAKQTVRAIFAEAAAIEDDSQRREVGVWAQKSESAAKIAAMIELAPSALPVLPEELDADPWIFNCKNGTVNLKTGVLQPHERRDLLTKCSDVDYDASATCPVFLAFLDRIMDGRTNLIQFIQLAIGYSLTGDTREQVMFILHGAGANGKSTLLNILALFLGDYALQTDTDTLMAKKNDAGINNDLARMKGARLVAGVETEENKRLAEVKIKQLTGGDTITARFLFQEFFEFKPQFKLFLATNHRPEIRGTDHAIWRRIRLIPFDVTFAPDEQDKGLLDKMKAELPGILAWAVKGCLKWQSEGLGLPDEVKEATESYREEMDVLAAFLSECCTVHAQAQVTAQELFAAYLKWCQENNEEPLKQTALGRRLSEQQFISTKGTGGKRGWKGLGLSAGLAQEKAEENSGAFGKVARCGAKNGYIEQNQAREDTFPKTRHNAPLSTNAPLFDERERVTL